MNKAELIEKVASETKNTRVQTETILDAALDVIQNAVGSNAAVKIAGFGTFCQLKRQARIGRNPQTGSELKIPATIVPKFKPGKEFKELLDK